MTSTPSTSTPVAAATPGPWTVDECPDAAANLTIRLADGTPNGDTDQAPIATVYSDRNAALIAAAPELRDALAAIVRTTGPDTEYACGRVDLDLHAAVRDARALLAELVVGTFGSLDDPEPDPAADLAAAPLQLWRVRCVERATYTRATVIPATSADEARALAEAQDWSTWSEAEPAETDVEIVAVERVSTGDPS